jgi:type IV pilus assembly protein PilY1
MVDSVPSDITVIDKDGDGLSDRIYFGTTGGTLWRINLADTREPYDGATGGSCTETYLANGISKCLDTSTGDLDDSDPAHWRAYELMSVGRHQTTGTWAPYDRRFLTAPDVVTTFDDFGQYDAVLLGSGDREDPFDDDNDDTMYLYKDVFISSRKAPYLRNDLANADDYAIEPSNLPATDADLQWYEPDQGDGNNGVISGGGSINNGWRFDLNDESGGEKIVGRPLVVAGVVFFTTYIPKDFDTDNPCIPSAGTGILYALNIEDTSAAFDLDLLTLPVGDLDQFVELESPGIPPPVVTISDGGPTNKLYVPGRPNPIFDTGSAIFRPTFWLRRGQDWD